MRDYREIAELLERIAAALESIEGAHGTGHSLGSRAGVRDWTVQQFAAREKTDDDTYPF